MGMKLQRIVKELQQLSKEDAFSCGGSFPNSILHSASTVLEVQLYGKQLSLIPKVHSLQVISKATHFERLGFPRDAKKLF